MANWNIFKKLGEVASHEAVPAEKGVNRAALAQLKAERDAQEALAKELAAGNNAPLSNDSLRNQLGDLDISSLPASKQAELGEGALVPHSGPNFTLGESGSVAVPSAREMAEVSSSNLPALTQQPPNLNGVNIPSSAEARYTKWKNIGLAGGAGLAGYAAMNSGDGTPPAQASIAPEVPKVPVPDAAKAPEENTPTEEEKVVLRQMADARRPGVQERNTVPEATPLDFGNASSVASVDRLKDIQQKMHDMQMANTGGRIGAAVATGAGGFANPFDSALADNAKEISKMPELYKQQYEMEKEDPNSAQSKGMRSLAGAMGFPISGNASAADLEKQLPQLANIYNQRVAQSTKKDLAREAREARSQDLALKYAQLKDSRLDKLGLKDEDRLLKINEKLNSPQMGSARNALGRNQLIINGAQKIGALIGSEKDPNNLTGRQVYEIAKSLDGMLSMGNPTISGTEHLLPKTIMSQLANSGEYVLNKPVGAQMGSFVKQMQHLINRETTVAERQNEKFKQQLVAGLPEDFANRRKKDLDRMLKVHSDDMAHEIDPKHPNSNMVKVQTKDGKIWVIPKEKLQDALDRKAVLVKE